MQDDIFDTGELELSEFFAMILGSLIISFPCYLISFQIATELGFGEWLAAWANDLHIIWKFIYYIVHISIGFLILVSLGTAIFTLGKLLFSGLSIVTDWLVENIHAAIENTVEFSIEITLSLIKTVLNIALFPVRFIVSNILSAIEYVQEKYEESQEIRRIFKEQYTADFKDFQEFKRYWDAVQRGEEPPYPGSEDNDEEEAEPKAVNCHAKVPHLGGDLHLKLPHLIC